MCGRLTVRVAGAPPEPMFLLLQEHRTVAPTAVLPGPAQAVTILTQLMVDSWLVLAAMEVARGAAMPRCVTEPPDG
jgi:hypothetical protein